MEHPQPCPTIYLYTEPTPLGLAVRNILRRDKACLVSTTSDDFFLNYQPIFPLFPTFPSYHFSKMLDIEPDFGEMSLLKFKDFVPDQISKNPWTGRTKYEPLGQMVREINHWMAVHPGIDVMNIETVVLPNIHEKKEEGSEDTELSPSAMGQYIWHQFFRVWYIDKRG